MKLSVNSQKQKNTKINFHHQHAAQVRKKNVLNVNCTVQLYISLLTGTMTMTLSNASAPDTRRRPDVFNIMLATLQAVHTLHSVQNSKE